MAYTKYSLTPANNNAAPPDGAPEGMLPSAVNDTMRDMMAQIRDCGDGIRGGTYTMTAPVITGGSISGITDLAVADGGTGASTAANARTNLGAAASGANSDITYLSAVTNTFGFKNRIINGAMMIDQRNAGASVTPASGAYLTDRWCYFAPAASKFTAQQNAGSVTPPVGFINYLGMTVASAVTVSSGDYYNIQQRIEGLNVSDLAWGTANAKTVTLSFQVYGSLTGTFGGAFTNSAANRSYPFTYSISVANTWTSISVTVAGDTTGTWLTTNGVGLTIQFGLGVGSTYSGTAGAWAAANYVSATGATSVVGTNGATFYITGVQLEVGSSASSFEVRDYGRELIMCQRYYEKAGWNTSQAPGSTSGYTGDCTLLRIPGLVNSYGGSMAYQVLKRTSPTITLYGSIAGATETSGIVVDFYTGNSLGASSAARIGDRQFTDISTTTDSTYGILFRFTASAEL